MRGLPALSGSSDFNRQVQCFAGSGKPIKTEQQGNVVTAVSEETLQEGRVRYNCTAGSGLHGRFYWFSRQWVYSN